MPNEASNLEHEVVHQAILARRSPRSFSSAEVSTSDLTTIFEAARWAASSYNEQPWRFLVGRKGEETYQKIFDSLGEFNQGWAKSAPILILSYASKAFAHNSAPNHYALHDTGAATALLTLQAWELGLRTHSMGGFDQEKVRSAFAISDEFEIGAVTALGHPGDGSELPEPVKKMEAGPRLRKPLAEIVLNGPGEPAKL